MTDLLKPVRRRSRAPFAHYRKRIVVSLEPGDVLAMRLERTRTTYRATIAAVFRTLADWHARAEVRRKREERKARRGL
ncbi:MAG: hypothetical protein HZA90_10370 [Verrucomicrobia bacterium]|nr:hypothetical protein [Verrucomicrobiota bacterium]